MPSKHPKRRRSRLPSSLTSQKPKLLLLPFYTLLFPAAAAATAIQYPIPASIFQTYTSAGNPILHIQPSFYHSSDPSSTSLLNFKSIFLANPSPEAYLETSLLSNGFFTQDVEGVQVPNFFVEGGKGVTLFSRKYHIDAVKRGEVREDNGEVWIMTYPVLCDDVGNATVEDYSLWRSGAGREDWEEVNLGVRKREVSVWFPSSRYLGRGFMVDTSEDSGGDSDASSVFNGGEKLYSFGGVCIGGEGYGGNGRNDTFSADVWRVENSTAVGGHGLRRRALGTNGTTTTAATSSSTATYTTTTSATSTAAAAIEVNVDPSSALDVSISIPKNPPIPEAGFSMTALRVKNSTSGNNNSTVDGMLILGGYTSQNRFVGLGQLALYSPKTEGWSFVSATLNDGSITPRAGHSAVVDENGERIILFGGWIGNITKPAKPSMVVLKVGGLDGGWEWDSFNATEEVDGAAPPEDLSLWGHAATLLEGNVMMLTSGFRIESLNDEGLQPVNQQTWFLNLTSNKWVERYHYPVEQLTKSAVEESTRRSHRDVAILAGVFGGLALLVAVLGGLFWYARRKEEYADLPNEGMSNDGGDKFHSLDLEYGKDIIVDGVPPLNFLRRGGTTTTDEAGGGGGLLLRENMTQSPELPPRPPAPLRTHRHGNQPSHVDMDMVERMREEQEQRENMFQESAAQEKRRSVRSEMVAWVREWANADAAAQAAEVMKRTRQDSATSGRVRKESSTLGGGGGGGLKDMYLRPGRAANNTPKSTAATTGAPDPGDNSRCITGSSMYSDGLVSTLDTSEGFYTPEEVPYPVPPMLLSSAQAYGEQSPRNPRVLVGPQGVTAPLPRKMAEEFPAPTLIPRDSLASSAYGSGYNHYSYSSTQPLLARAQSSSARDSEGWRDITPSSSYPRGSSNIFTTIPLTTFEEETHIRRGKSLEDRVREEMYNPGPGKTDDDCRLSSIMDYYADSTSPSPIPELSEGTDSEDDEGEEGYLVPSGSGGGVQTTTYAGERAVVGGKGKMVLMNTAVEEPVTISPIRIRSKGESQQQQQQQSRESVVAPLLSETIAAQQKEEAIKTDKPTSRSRIPSLGSSIKRRAAAMAATLTPSAQSSERRSTSLSRKNVLRRPQTSSAGQKPSHATVSESTPLQPQQAEIMNINDRATDILFTRGFEDRDDGSSTHMNDKVVQLVYTAPKGKLRVVNPSPRRVSSGGTDGSLGLFQQMNAHRRVSSSGNFGVISNGEGILRLGSAAARRVGELD
ncbi:hypothetical protein TWF281_003593 [Arthrobotrys megalospora]